MMSNKQRMATYETLVGLNGISGYEKSVRKYMKEELTKVSDNIIQDRLGSIFGVKKGSSEGPVIMVAGHMDEVGAMVIGITDKGFLKIQPIGGLNAEVMVSQNVEVVVDFSKTIKGVVASTPPHLTKDDQPNPKIDFDSLLVDVGADSKEHVEQMGIKIGAQVLIVNSYYFTEDGKKIVSKAWDNRFGCGMALEILRELQGKDHPNTVISGATVQEEVGLRGAVTASQMVKPDLFIAVDVSPVGDFLEKPHPKAFGKLGEGFLIRFYDPRNIMNPEIKAYFEELAKKHNIKIPRISFDGRNGCGCCTVCRKWNIRNNHRSSRKVYSFFHIHDPY
jgi:glutamyl aminopeptidase